MKVVHIISGLGTGGAEHMLLKLLTVNANNDEHVVVSLTGKGDLGSDIEELDVRCVYLDLSTITSGAKSIFQLRRLLREVQPDIVQTWMYHADLIGGIIAKMSSCRNIIWNIRNTDLDKEKTRLHTRLTMRLCALLSHVIPKKIITNSTVAARLHHSLGYADKFIVIPNGFLTEKFIPSEDKQSALRKTLGIPESALVVGLFARFDPQKNHQGFIESAAMLVKKCDHVVFVLAGSQINARNAQLLDWIRQYQLEDVFYLLDRRTDMENITSMCDVACLSSTYGEAFPNVIGEAMACAVPCVATNVGDVKDIIGDEGIVIPPNDSRALCEALYTLLMLSEDERCALGKNARKRIQAHFGIDAVSKHYQRTYKEVLN